MVNAKGKRRPICCRIDPIVAEQAAPPPCDAVLDLVVQIVGEALRACCEELTSTKQYTFGEISIGVKASCRGDRCFAKLLLD